MQYFSHGTGLLILTLVLVAGFIFTGLAFRYSSRRDWTGQALIPSALISLALLFFSITFDFPGEKVGPALIPRIWIFCLIGLCGTILFFTIRGREDKDPKAGRIGFVLFGIAIMIVYFFAIQTLGYFISSVIFLAVMMYVLSCRKPLTIVLVSMGWLVFSYVVFYKLLYIQLPLGFLENYL